MKTNTIELENNTASEVLQEPFPSLEEKKIEILSLRSEQEKRSTEHLFRLFKDCPIPEAERLSNLPLFMKRQDLTGVLFINELYQKILQTNGSILEFGVRWGKNLALFESLRGIYEPYNHTRKIIGFDTFDGFRSVDSKDGKDRIIKDGAFSVTDGYEYYLDEVLCCLEKESPIPHIQKHRLIKGNAIDKVDEYLEANPHTIIALAYFDFDIYAPTRKCLERILNYVTKGTILAFDQLNHYAFPGETLALKEVLGLDKYTIQRSAFSSYQSYIVL